jgi:hypothetical protein
MTGRPCSGTAPTSWATTVTQELFEQFSQRCRGPGRCGASPITATERDGNDHRREPFVDRHWRQRHRSRRARPRARGQRRGGSDGRSPTHRHHRAHEGRWRLQLDPSTRQLNVFLPNGSLHSQCLPDSLPNATTSKLPERCALPLSAASMFSDRPVAPVDRLCRDRSGRNRADVKSPATRRSAPNMP